MSTAWARKHFVLSVMFLCPLLADSAFAQTATQEIQITAVVGKACTINGADTGTVDTAEIPIDASGNVNTSAITPDHPAYYNTVVCNAPATIQLRSQEGAVKNTAVPPGGYSNIIDYQASAQWNSATATLDTSTVPTATAAETGTAVPVAAGSGAMTISITPLLNTSPLEGGTYTDSLFVLLEPVP